MAGVFTMNTVFSCRHAPLVLAPSIVDRLSAAYAEPQRAYHTATHIHEVLHWFDVVHEEVGWRSPADVYLAVVFHDAVYDPTRHDNEARSAQLARELAGASDAAVRLIDLTAQHGKLDGKTLDHDAAHFLDSDTAILGAPAAAFDDYDAAIAVEYKHVPRDAYRAGRLAFLMTMLAKDRIYFTDYFHARLDRAARDNLARAIAKL
jgi:predicted metal-dependent HD superfamily phosphohydrolase